MGKKEEMKFVGYVQRKRELPLGESGWEWKKEKKKVSPAGN